VEEQGLHSICSVFGDASPQKFRDSAKSGTPLAAPSCNAATEALMDWDRIQGTWKQFLGRVKEQWGKLTDDDLAAINGRRDRLEGRIQERYGYAKDKTRKAVDEWLHSLNQRS
jgi:uncharacterized protein YjbJ (UPF0337 family)